jgi:hypothetical protein
VPVIGAAATAEHLDVRQQAAQLPVLFAALNRIADVQRDGGGEFRMVLARGVGAHGADALRPVGACGQHVGKNARDARN